MGVSKVTDIIPVYTIDQMVATWERTQETFRTSFEAIAKAEEELHAVFGSYDRYSNFSPFCYGFRWNYKDWESCLDDSLKQVQSSIWRKIMQKIGLEKFVTEKRQKEIEENLKYHRMPPLTREEILNFLKLVSDNSDDLFHELLMDVFKFLRPAMWDRHKTNKRYEIGRKVILARCCDFWSGEYRSSGFFYDHSDDLSRTDRAFHLLDGKGVPDGYHSELVDAINTSGVLGVGETEYFKFRCHKNGNLHLEFKRLDLLRELNAKCGGLALKGEA